MSFPLFFRFPPHSSIASRHSYSSAVRCTRTEGKRSCELLYANLRVFYFYHSCNIVHGLFYMFIFCKALVISFNFIFVDMTNKRCVNYFLSLFLKTARLLDAQKENENSCLKKKKKTHLFCEIKHMFKKENNLQCVFLVVNFRNVCVFKTCLNWFTSHFPVTLSLIMKEKLRWNWIRPLKTDWSVKVDIVQYFTYIMHNYIDGQCLSFQIHLSINNNIYIFFFKWFGCSLLEFCSFKNHIFSILLKSLWQITPLLDQCVSMYYYYFFYLPKCINIAYNKWGNA